MTQRALEGAADGEMLSVTECDSDDVASLLEALAAADGRAMESLRSERTVSITCLACGATSSGKLDT